MKVCLLPNIEDFGSDSMNRYHHEIVNGLSALISETTSIEDYQMNNPQYLKNLLPVSLSAKWSSRIGRWLAYPFKAAGIKADIFHILDQSHANLGLVLDPKKTVVTCHDIIPLLSLKGKLDIPAPAVFTYPFLVSSMRRAAHIIAISESTKKGLIEEAGFAEDKISVIYNGVNPAFCSKESDIRRQDAQFLRSEQGLPFDSKIILHVGTNSHYKNSSAIIRALAELLKEQKFNSNIYLLRLGADFFPEEKSLIAQLGVESHIIYGGKIHTDESLARYYRGADLFVFPSVWEGFGWPPLESMACGTPVLTSNVASLPEIVGTAGLMVSPHDYLELSRSIERLLKDNTLWDKMAYAGLERSKIFSWEKAAKQTLSVYEHIYGAYLAKP